MMPIVEQSPVHHHHGHGHQTFYHPQHLPEQCNKIQLTLILPNGVPSAISVDANTPMMDLLVQAASLNKLNPSGYSLVVLDSNQHVIHFKANQTVGQIVKNCHLPQINGSSTISLLPKETTQSNSTSKTKTQPFEITVRLQVNLPDAQKILLRVDPTLPLFEIKEQICKQKKYIHSNEYTLRLPTKLDQPILLGLSLAEYKTNELTLIHHPDFQFEHQLNTTQHQSFDRLYRSRSDMQPPKETLRETSDEQQLNHLKQDRQSNPQPQTHTSLHAYWNDPNFDTQSQISTSSSIAKKRRAPKPPGGIGSNQSEPQIIYIQQQHPPMHTYSPSRPLRVDHHQSQESLHLDNTKKKRKAPIVAGTNSVQKKEEIEQQQNTTDNITRPGLEPPPPPNTFSPSTNDVNEDLHRPAQEINEKSVGEPQKEDFTIHATDNQYLPELQTPTNKSPSNSPELRHTNSHSSTQTKRDSPNLTPIIIQQYQEDKSEQKFTPTEISSVTEAIQSNATKSPLLSSPVPKPPRQSVTKEKKSTTIDGLLRIITDHSERATNYQDNEKQQKETNENVSYFRVAKSRYGKFETDNRGFVNNSIAIFDSTNQPRSERQSIKNSHTSQTLPSIPSAPSQKLFSNTIQHPSKGKQAYSILRKYEQEEQLPQPMKNHHYMKKFDDKEQSPTPIQLEVTERTTHITVTVESDRKQLISKTSSMPQQQLPSPPIVAPKPVSKIITEHRTIRRTGNGDESTTIRNGTTSSSYETNNKRLTSMDNDDRSSTNSGTSHEDLMESIRRFGGSQNLGRK